MSHRKSVIIVGIAASAIFLAIFFTRNHALFGLLIGFLTGFVNIQWLFWDADKAIDEDLHVAIRRYRKSLFSRLGMVTMVVATVGRFRSEWLFLLALGIAVGVIIPLIMAIREQLVRGRG